MVLAVGLLRIGPHGDRHGFGRYQLVGEAGQYAPLDVVAANRPAVVAGPLAEMTKAAVAVIDDDAILAAATSASEQARQEEGRTAETVQPFGVRLADSLDRRSELLRQRGLAQLHPLP
jgi:hypothetical protein